MILGPNIEEPVVPDDPIDPNVDLEIVDPDLETVEPIEENVIPDEPTLNTTDQVDPNEPSEISESIEHTDKSSDVE